MFFYAIGSIFASILQSHNHFLAPALGTVLIDVGQIIGVVLLAFLYEFSTGGGINLLNTGRVALFIGLFMLLAPLALRLQGAPAIPSRCNLEHVVRMLAITRMDSIGWGALAAMLAAASPAAWRAIRWPGLFAGMAGILANAALYGEERLWYSATFFYTVNAVSMALLLPLLSGWSEAPRWGAPIAFISLVSYALYLVHQPVRGFFNRIWAGADRPEGLLLVAAYWAVCIALSWLVHRFWERRFMAIRDGIGRRLGVGG
ncbi:MAG: hypothetical protein ACK4L7_00745, partial [Flavobacteriales bacterium]